MDAKKRFRGSELSESEPPLFDDHGINLADPNDRLGIKSAYITRLQIEALSEILGAPTGRILDLGCGYGRTTLELAARGWDVVGSEPSIRVLQHARRARAMLPLVAGALPDLPFRPQAFEVVLLINVVRSLHLLGIAEIVRRAVDYVAPRGRLVVLDNMRPGHPDYVDENWLIELFRAAGLDLEMRRAIRWSRWPPIYAIRYGLVPSRLIPWLIRWERCRMRRAGPPRCGYHNVIFVFRRP